MAPTDMIMKLVARETIPGHYPAFGLWLPIIFDVLQAIGGAGNLALIITLLSAKGLRRHATWLSFCIAWVFSSLSYLVLAFAGKQSGPPPGYALCLSQAVLVYGAPVMTLYAMLAIVIQLWAVVAHITSRVDTPRQEALWQKSLLFVPYGFALVVSITALVIGIQDKPHVQRAGSGVYCVINNGIPGRINAVLCVLAALAMLAFEISIGMKCYKHKKAYNKNTLPMALLVRVFIFTAVGLLGIGISFVFVTEAFSPLPNIFLGCMPLCAFIVFGTQQDIIDVWLCRRKKGVPASPSPTDSRTGLKSSA